MPNPSDLDDLLLLSVLQRLQERMDDMERDLEAAMEMLALRSQAAQAEPAAPRASARQARARKASVSKDGPRLLVMPVPVCGNSQA